jgi:hypothetical protein
LEHAVRDFVAEVVALKENLGLLSAEAAGTERDARHLFLDDSGQTSFMTALRMEADAASRTLLTYADAEADVLCQVESVAAGFSAMVGDLDTVHSIDADMRIMGLNASLKCGRLGQQGRALGVVAQELRACSRRTQETAAIITDAITEAGASANDLARHAQQGHANAQELQQAIDAAMVSLGETGDALFVALDKVLGGCASVSALMDGAAGGITIHDHLQRNAAPLLASLDSIAASLGNTGLPIPDLQDDVRRLLASHYTMASERIIHGIDDPAAQPVEACADIDDLFF